MVLSFPPPPVSFSCKSFNYPPMRLSKTLRTSQILPYPSPFTLMLSTQPSTLPSKHILKRLASVHLYHYHPGPSHHHLSLRYSDIAMAFSLSLCFQRWPSFRPLFITQSNFMKLGLRPSQSLARNFPMAFHFTWQMVMTEQELGHCPVLLLMLKFSSSVVYGGSESRLAFGRGGQSMGENRRHPCPGK